MSDTQRIPHKHNNTIGKAPVPVFTSSNDRITITYTERKAMKEVRCAGVIKSKGITCNRVLGKFSVGSVIEIECCGGQCKHKTVKKVA